MFLIIFSCSLTSLNSLRPLWCLSSQMSLSSCSLCSLISQLSHLNHLSPFCSLSFPSSPFLSLNLTHHCPLPLFQFYPTKTQLLPFDLIGNNLKESHMHRAMVAALSIFIAWSHPWLEHGFFGLKWNGSRWNWVEVKWVFWVEANCYYGVNLMFGLYIRCCKGLWRCWWVVLGYSGGWTVVGGWLALSSLEEERECEVKK